MGNLRLKLTQVGLDEVLKLETGELKLILPDRSSSEGLLNLFDLSVKLLLIDIKIIQNLPKLTQRTPIWPKLG